jgi:hypothetical protein
MKREESEECKRKEKGNVCIELKKKEISRLIKDLTSTHSSCILGFVLREA